MELWGSPYRHGEGQVGVGDHFEIVKDSRCNKGAYMTIKLACRTRAFTLLKWSLSGASRKSVPIINGAFKASGWNR